MPRRTIRSARKRLETLISAHLSLLLSPIKTPHPRCVGVWQNDRVEIIANEQVSSELLRSFEGGPARMKGMSESAEASERLRESRRRTLLPPPLLAVFAIVRLARGALLLALLPCKFAKRVLSTGARGEALEAAQGDPFGSAAAVRERGVHHLSYLPRKARKQKKRRSEIASSSFFFFLLCLRRPLSLSLFLFVFFFFSLVAHT